MDHEKDRLTLSQRDAYERQILGHWSLTTGMQWDYNPVYLFKFKKYGVVGIYVRQARLGNGGIWNFDEDFIKNEFSEKEKSPRKEAHEHG